MKSEKTARLIRGVLLIIVIICLIQIANIYYSSMKHKEQQKKMRDSINVENMQSDADASSDDISQDNALSADILTRFETLYEQNNDLVGWLAIEDTDIDYPVVQCEDDEYYLYHNFNKEKDKYGCLFVKSRADINTPETNFIIYGHSMKDGSMFGSLADYESFEFYQKHSLIRFDTLYEERIYEVMAVFPSQVYGEDEDTFKYYQFYQADTEEEFNYFYENVKNLSLYDTGVTAEYGDTFITLSTCAYHVEDGRFVVVAKRLGL